MGRLTSEALAPMIAEGCSAANKSVRHALCKYCGRCQTKPIQNKPNHPKPKPNSQNQTKLNHTKTNQPKPDRQNQIKPNETKLTNKTQDNETITEPNAKTNRLIKTKPVQTIEARKTKSNQKNCCRNAQNRKSTRQIV